MTPTLRPIHKTDLARLVKHANNKAISNQLTDAFPFPYTEEQGRGFIEMTSKNDPRNILAIAIENELIGAIGIHPKTDIDRMNAEMGYWIAEAYWGKGIVTKAIQQMVVYTFDHFPDIARIFARPYGDNLASQRVLEKAGFTLEARFKATLIKNEEIKDEFVYAIRRP
ncbi:MAG: GNAT family N-acetyltransferase [Flavobacteriales bacterium]|nr:GNAT family N-acetyltransferase [Flavobacteriales bacterium]